MESNFSDVGICNSGVVKVGGETISSFTDGTRTSNLLQAQYPILRDEVMRAAAWRFALTQRTLGVPNATAPLFDYMAAYDIPNDILRVWKVATPDWTEIGNQILCNKTDGIDCLCVFQNTDPTSWDAQFAEALAWRVAQEVAMALVQSAPLAKSMGDNYEKAVATARSANAIIGTPDRLIADTWSNARKYGFNRLCPINAGTPEPYGG